MRFIFVPILLAGLAMGAAIPSEDVSLASPLYRREQGCHSNKQCDAKDIKKRRCLYDCKGNTNIAMSKFKSWGTVKPTELIKKLLDACQGEQCDPVSEKGVWVVDDGYGGNITVDGTATIRSKDTIWHTGGGNKEAMIRGLSKAVHSQVKEKDKLYCNPGPFACAGDTNHEHIAPGHFNIYFPGTPYQMEFFLDIDLDIPEHDFCAIFLQSAGIVAGAIGVEFVPFIGAALLLGSMLCDA